MAMVEDALASIGGLSPAQRKVLVTLKRRGEASADDIAETLGITAGAVRQHLAALRSAELVDSRQERGRPGRPVDLYHATELAEAMVPETSGTIMLELLQDIEAEDPELVSRVFERRRYRRVEEVRAQLAGRNLDKKVAALAQILDGEGYLTDYEALADDTYRIVLHNCAIWGVATRYPQACASELEFLREVLDEATVERTTHKVSGSYRCSYEIRPAIADTC